MSPEFHQTKRGQIFFDYQLPKLIDNIGRVADGLEKDDKSNFEIDPFNDGEKVGYILSHKGSELVRVEENEKEGTVNVYVRETNGQDYSLELTVNTKEV
jgi:hypothetical protein